MIITSNRSCLILTAVCCTLLLAGCKQPELDSHWREDALVIDGELSDWRNYLPYFVDDSPAVVGFSNDADYLYLRFSSRDPALQRQIRAGTLTVWFDPSGDTEKIFGVGFPAAAPPRSGKRKDLSQDESEKKASMPPRKQRLELRGADGQRLAVIGAGGADYGIEAAMGNHNGNLLCELKVPLAATADRLFAIGATADTQIGIGWVTQQPERKNKTSAQVFGRGSGGGRGDKGGGVGRGGRGGDRQTLQTEPLDLWVRLQLAPVPNTEAAGPQG